MGQIAQHILFPSAQRTASDNSQPVTLSGKGGIFVLDITVDAGGTLDVKIQGFSPLGNDYYDITSLAFAQQSGVGTNYLAIYPGIAETANVSVSDILPPMIRAVATMATTPDMTFSLIFYEVD